MKSIQRSLADALSLVNHSRRSSRDEDASLLPKTGSSPRSSQWLQISRSGSQTEEPSKIRCSYWPNCTRGDLCKYHHPSEPCGLFPNCPYGDACFNVHSQPVCKFGSNCSRIGCTFSHPAASIPLITVAAPSQIRFDSYCLKGFSCGRDHCLFKHLPEACRFGKNCTKGPMCHYSHAPPCHFGSNCSRQYCEFSHTRHAHFKALCKYGSHCKNEFECKFLHPESVSAQV